MSEEKDCSSVAGVQAGLRPTDEPCSAGCVGPTPGKIMHRVNAEQFKPNGWVDSYPTWEDYDDAGRAKWEEMARRFTFLSSGVSRSQSEAKPSASAFAQDEQKAELRHRAEVAEAAAALMAEQRDSLQAQLETAERERDDWKWAQAQTVETWDKDEEFWANAVETAEATISRLLSELETARGEIEELESLESVGGALMWKHRAEAAEGALVQADIAVEAAEDRAQRTEADLSRALDELKLWRSLVIEGGVPRYTVVPGAALNSVVTSTDALLGGANG